MSVLGLNTTGGPSVGNDAGWALSIGGSTIDRNDHYADITAGLPQALGGGEYTFVVEGLAEDSHVAVAADAAPSSRDPARLYLYWRDTLGLAASLGSFGGLGEIAAGLLPPELSGALVAELKIRGVSRHVGAHGYETHIQARERAFDALTRPMALPLEIADVGDAARVIGERAGVEVRVHPIQGATSEAAGTAGLRPGITYADALSQLARTAEILSGRFGRGMLLIRDGIVHFGPRPIPLDGTEPKPLTPGNDLLDVEALSPLSSDPWAAGDEGEPTSTRAQYRLILKGRADLKPGDLVQCPLPREEAAGVGSFALPRLGDMLALLEEQEQTTLYVVSVGHRLGRATGFVTTLTTVAIDSPDQAWDQRAPASAEARRAADSDVGSTPNAALSAAAAVRRAARGAVAQAETVDVAEVRAAQSTPSDELAAQTVTLWRGLESPDGLPNAARRLPVLRGQPTSLSGVGYLSPFAWGPCGLVLPRYPGTRVIVAHRHGDAADPLDVGCLWESGHAPESQPGDWWLILPVGVPHRSRGSTEGPDAPPEHTGPASNDLIDADGNRVIEVGELTIRVGRKSLKNAGERPTREKPLDTITIEHADGGASIVIDKDGAITVKAKKTLALKSEDGDITLEAKNVKVKVSATGTMDVS